MCSVDLENRPFIPFGGPGTVAKCDESKFNHRPKVNIDNFSAFAKQTIYPIQWPGNGCEV